MIEKAYFGGGCFWCTEAVFAQLDGVSSVLPGYSGGTTDSPDYYQVSEGNTGHAEVIEVVFDSARISYSQLLDVFFHTHNPTTLNQQGADVGTQYRSVIFYTSEEQKSAAEEMKRELQRTNEFGQPVVTEITQFTRFYLAEQYHQNYYQRNADQSYCSVVITPKLSAFHKRYAHLEKKSQL